VTVRFRVYRRERDETPFHAWPRPATTAAHRVLFEERTVSTADTGNVTGGSVSVPSLRGALDIGELLDLVSDAACRSYSTMRSSIIRRNVIRNIETKCKILKQVADRLHYHLHRSECGGDGHFCTRICEHWMRVRVGLSEREAKFFLDRKNRSAYHSHKFSGVFPVRAKFHLHGKGKVVNWCSHFFEGHFRPRTRVTAV
jgi:hypothetical protein